MASIVEENVPMSVEKEQTVAPESTVNILTGEEATKESQEDTEMMEVYVEVVPVEETNQFTSLSLGDNPPVLSINLPTTTEGTLSDGSNKEDSTAVKSGGIINEVTQTADANQKPSLTDEGKILKTNNSDEEMAVIEDKGDSNTQCIVNDDDDDGGDGNGDGGDDDGGDGDDDEGGDGDDDDGGDGDGDDDEGDGDDDEGEEADKPSKEETEKKVSKEHDPFHYTKTGDFTSEIFKVELGNLPKKCGYKQFKKMIHTKLNGIKPVKVKLLPNCNHSYVTFRSEDDRKRAIKCLNKQKWKGKWMYARPAKPLADPVIQQRAAGLARKRTIEDAANANLDVKRYKSDKEQTPKHDETLAVSIRLNHSVTPLWTQPYDMQVATKYRGIVDVLKRLTKQLKTIITMRGNWVQEESAQRKGLCCALEDCILSPTLDGYRNKCEFTIAEGPDGEKTVGFRLGSYKDGYSGVVDPSECIHISDMAKAIAKTFQQYIRQSPLPTYCLCFHTGYWQTLTARTTLKGESMAILQFSPQNMSKEEIEEEKRRVLTYFTEGEGKDLKLTSLYLQINPTRAVGGNAEAPLTLLMGQEHIYEEMAGLKFRISPDAFFQVNTRAAEKMFDIIKEWCSGGADEGKDTIIMDICCGTGTIGLTLAKGVRRLIGIESCENAVKDAIENARLNGITNAEFHAGKAEDVMINIMKNLPRKTKVIGIMDPPRAGLHQCVLHAIRKCRKMEKLIYVSCNASAAFGNFLDLCRPTSKRQKASPFRLVKAVPIDLFPHTKHCEVLLLFERDSLCLDAARFYKLYY